MCGDYATAADNFLNSSFPRFGYHAEAAGCLAQSQKPDEARLQVEQVLRMNPGFTVSEYVDGLAFADPADRQRHKDILATTRLPL
jgi:hypothetical protein